MRHDLVSNLIFRKCLTLVVISLFKTGHLTLNKGRAFSKNYPNWIFEENNGTKEKQKKHKRQSMNQRNVAAGKLSSGVQCNCCAVVASLLPCCCLVAALLLQCCCALMLQWRRRRRLLLFVRRRRCNHAIDRSLPTISHLAFFLFFNMWSPTAKFGSPATIKCMRVYYYYLPLSLLFLAFLFLFLFTFRTQQTKTKMCRNLLQPTQTVFPEH